MKAKIFILVAIMLALYSIVSAQQSMDKLLYGKNAELGGDVKIKKSTTKIKGDETYRILEIEAPTVGNYYLKAWLLATRSKNGFLKYDIEINGLKTNNSILPEKSNWQAVELKDEKRNPKTIYLKAGHNTIAFVAKAPEIPEVEFIRLTKDYSTSSISDKKYLDFIEDIKRERRVRANTTFVEKDTLDLIMKNVVLPNPEGNYYHHIGVNFSYTWYKNFYFSAGKWAYFQFYGDYFPHVAELFSYDMPENYTWVSRMINGTCEGDLYVKIPKSGTYTLRVRTWVQGTTGLVTVAKDFGAEIWENCPAAGIGFRHAHETPTTYNYFTCKLTGDSRIWIEDDSGIPGKIRAFNDDYYGGGDFSWGLASRVKKDFSVRIGATLISSFSSYNPVGTCDLYIMCKNSSIMNYFPSLKPDDAIQTAPESSSYNCASWGGGLIDRGRYFWASNPPNSNNLSGNWYVAGNFWQSWDNFFGNNPLRFSGAPTYTRSDANSSNGEIAMWYNSTSYQYTHFSVTKPANDQPHGYDWESKPGGLMRTFHPRDALNDNSYNGYGQISLYYKRINPSLKSYSLKESVNLGLTVLQDITLNEEEVVKLSTLKANILNADINVFNHKLQKLIDKSNTQELIIHSNPFFIYQTNEFKDMLNYCKNKGETIWPILFENIFDEINFDARDLSVLLLNETTPEFGYLMEEVKEEWKNNNYTIDGAYIAPSPIDNTKNYVKKLLRVKPRSSITSKVSIQDIDNHDLFSVYPNPFKYQTNVIFNIAENSSKVSLKVLDMSGNLLEIVINNQEYKAGSQQILWSANDYKSGIYLFNLTINGKQFNRRFLIE